MLDHRFSSSGAGQHTLKDIAKLFTSVVLEYTPLSKDNFIPALQLLLLVTLKERAEGDFPSFSLEQYPELAMMMATIERLMFFAKLFCVDSPFLMQWHVAVFAQSLQVLSFTDISPFQRALACCLSAAHAIGLSDEESGDTLESLLQFAEGCTLGHQNSPRIASGREEDLELLECELYKRRLRRRHEYFIDPISRRALSLSEHTIPLDIIDISRSDEPCCAHGDAELAEKLSSSIFPKVAASAQRILLLAPGGLGKSLLMKRYASSPQV